MLRLSIYLLSNQHLLLLNRKNTCSLSLFSLYALIPLSLSLSLSLFSLLSLCSHPSLSLSLSFSLLFSLYALIPLCLSLSLFLSLFSFFPSPSIWIPLFLGKSCWPQKNVFTIRYATKEDRQEGREEKAVEKEWKITFGTLSLSLPTQNTHNSQKNKVNKFRNFIIKLFFLILIYDDSDNQSSFVS